MNYNTVLFVISINQLVAFAQYQGENDYNHVAPGVPPQAYNPPTQQGTKRTLVYLIHRRYLFRPVAILMSLLFLIVTNTYFTHSV